MTQLVQLVEHEGRPAIVAVSAELGEELAVWALLDQVEEERGLRATVLRRADEAPPAGAVFVCSVEPFAARGGVAFRVQRTGRHITLELLRPDSRTRVTTAPELRSGSRFEVTLPNQRRVQFGVQVAATVVQEARAAVGGSGTQRSMAANPQRGVLWVVPTAWQLLTDPDDSVKEMAFEVLKRTGLTARSFALMAGALSFLLVSGGAWYQQYQEKLAAQQEASAAKQAAADADAARTVAIRSEATCLGERQTLVARLGEIEAEREMQAELALAGSASQSIAVEVGGKRFAADPLLDFDRDAVPGMKRFVVTLLDHLRDDASEAGRCAALDGELGTDLPHYLLLWHPDADLVCPVQYAAVEGGVSMIGRWGLSERVARQYGVPDPAMPGPVGADDPTKDPRMDDRWAAQALTASVRAIQTTILQHEGGGRPTVSPSQAQLWALAFFGAYDRMTSPAGGAMDATAEVCVGGVLDDLVAASAAPAPGEPVLPDIARVATGEVAFAARPTPGCPWPADAFKVSAEGALRAVARTARLAEAPAVARD